MGRESSGRDVRSWELIWMEEHVGVREVHLLGSPQSLRSDVVDTQEQEQDVVCMREGELPNAPLEWVKVFDSGGPVASVNWWCGLLESKTWLPVNDFQKYESRERSETPLR